MDPQSSLDEVHLPAFYYRMLHKGLTFFSSSQPKNIEKRIGQKKSDMKQILSLGDFLTTAKLCKAGHIYLHMGLSSTKNKPSPLFVVDIDSNLNSQVAIDYCRSQSPTAMPVINKTPNGVHLFFDNLEKRRYRITNKVLALGILADLLPRGYVTILGPGYSLSFGTNDKFVPSKLRKDTNVVPLVPKDDYNPLVQIPAPPLGFSLSNSTTPFITNGSINVKRNLMYFLNHFNLNKKYSIKLKSLSKTLHECVKFLIRTFKRSAMPMALQKLFSLLGLFEMYLVGTENIVFVPKEEDPSSSEEESEEEDDFIIQRSIFLGTIRSRKNQSVTLGSIEDLDLTTIKRKRMLVQD